MADLPKSPLWPEEADFLRILCYMKVPHGDAESIIGHISHLKPYLMQIEYESDMDFLVLLNGITTKVVFTPSDDRAKLVSNMIRDLCEAEGFEDKHNLPPVEEDVFYDSEESSDVDCAQAAPLDPLPIEEPPCCSRIVSTVNEERPGCPEEDRLPLPTTQLSKAKRRQLRRKKLEQHRDTPIQLPRPTEDLRDIKIHQSRRVNTAMKNLKHLQSAALDQKLAKRALAKKVAAFEQFEIQIVKLLGHEAGELIPLQTFVSNKADLDWVQFRGTSDKMNRLMDRLLK